MPNKELSVDVHVRRVCAIYVWCIGLALLRVSVGRRSSWHLKVVL